MSQILMAVFCFVIYLIIYYLVGVALSKILKLNNDPLEELLYGSFVYELLFFVYVLPLKFKIVPVTTIGVIWAIFVGVMCVAIIVVLHKYIAIGLMGWINGLKNRKICFMLVSLYFIIFLFFIEFFGRLPHGHNQVWFLGWPSNAVLHNELMTYDTETGLPLEKFLNERYLSTFLDHSAIVCKLTGLHVMVEVRTVLTAVFILLQVIVVWKVASYFGKDSNKKSLFAFFVYWSIRNLLVGSQLLPSYYTVFRTYEGKGFVMNVPIPLLVLLLWKMYDNPEDIGYLWKSCLVIAGAMTYSLSMMFSTPFLLVSYIPFVIAKKDMKLIRNMMVLLFVSGIYVIIYYLGQKGIIDLTIQRTE
ncbi:hypothetical protein SAMN02910369_02570 [Lachnospiraceae bacterium NE2001]|nr:hypothetical protein SAMN02910369_02570 [Lachnospiraceae bacterium NE2001]